MRRLKSLKSHLPVFAQPAWQAGGPALLTAALAVQLRFALQTVTTSRLQLRVHSRQRVAGQRVRRRWLLTRR